MKYLHFPRFLPSWRHTFCFHHRILESAGALFLFYSFSCFLQTFDIFSKLEHLILCCPFCSSWNSFFFCLCLLTIARRSLQLSAECLHLRCGMQYFLLGRRALNDSSLDSPTLELELSLFLFLEDFLKDFLAADEDFFLSFSGSKFSTLVSKKSVFSLMVDPA